jgi:hypothetical protein
MGEGCRGVAARSGSRGRRRTSSGSDSTATDVSDRVWRRAGVQLATSSKALH